MHEILNETFLLTSHGKDFFEINYADILLPKGSDTAGDDEGTQQDKSDSGENEVEINESIGDTCGNVQQLTNAEKVEMVIDGIQFNDNSGGESATYAQGIGFTESSVRIAVYASHESTQQAHVLFNNF